MTANGSALKLNYSVNTDIDMVIVIRNANPDQPCQLSMQVADRSHFSLKRFLPEAFIDWGPSQTE